ncbi:ABC transporter ATP-binding protein [Alphaproteobacteria bacterium]|nr:ABC transporter ATP-binding protein [Alphaproteobacteria bacterium]
MMKQKVSLIADNLHLHLRIPAVRTDYSSKDSKIGGRIFQDGKKFFVAAVDGVSFQLQEGDRLGLLGHNGSGKSSLLRVLAGIYPPTRGNVKAIGKVGSVLNIGLGFRPEASGERNIVIKSHFEGIPRDQIGKIISDVAEFSELGPYLNYPISSYSQGMRMRLAFGICTAFRYDILLLDEWLGAGDASFQTKAKERLNSFTNTKIVVLASHNPSLINSFCTQTLHMEKGRIIEGNVHRH